MNFANELHNKLTSYEWSLCASYVKKAQEYYDADKDPAARSALQDAVAVCEAAGEYNAANKISYYLRFC